MCVGSEALPVLFVPTEIIKEIDTGSNKRVSDHSPSEFSACGALLVQTDIRADADPCLSLTVPEMYLDYQGENFIYYEISV